MRFVRLRGPGESHLGVIIGDWILDLAASEVASLQAGLPVAMREVFDSGSQQRVGSILAKVEESNDRREQLIAKGALVPYAAADLAAPIDDPALLLAIGMNYHDHLRELNAPAPSTPYAFTKSSASIVGPRDRIILPKSNPGMVDLEGELVIVIGAPCFHVSEAEAERSIGGYTIANDVSARDWVAGAFQQSALMDVVGAWGLNLLGKQFPTFCPIGPFMLTADEIAGVGSLQLISRVNGEIFQSSDTGQMIFSPAQIIAYFSQFYRFGPGDMILTGTPAGVGFSRKPQRFFKAGDVVEIEIERLGSLRNTVSAG